MEYLKSLNKAQKEAVLQTEGPLLIVAGAGAGKTRTLVHRIAHLVASGVPPTAILAVTFTNKAAGEMRERVRALLAGVTVPTTGHGSSPRPVWGGTPLVVTFHSLCVRILREFADEAGVHRRFVIWDRDDSIRAIKVILKKLDIEWSPRGVLETISRAKGRGLSREEFEKETHAYREQTIANVWKTYEKMSREEGALDFDDLLAEGNALLVKNARVRSLLQARWSHIHIDEYQDTNRVQYELVRLIADARDNVCAVGDVDQCLVAGTQITVEDGTHRPVESIRAGDMVLSNNGSGRLLPTRVLKIMKRTCSGKLVQITTRAGHVVTSTPEHIHFAGYKLGVAPQIFFTYLMFKRGKGFRLGISAVYTKGQRKPVVGFVLRSNHEHADKVWIVGTHASPNEARVHEYKLSLLYRIPTLPFMARNSKTKGGYVHDQDALNEIFATFDTVSAGNTLLKNRGLSFEYPHHRAQATAGGKRNIVITLCGDGRGKRPLHRIAMAASDGGDRDALRQAGFSIRKARRSSAVAWRFETACTQYEEVFTLAKKIRATLPHAEVVQMARLGRNKKNKKNGNSLPFLPAASVLPGMAMFDEKGDYDIVERVEYVNANKTPVYDLNVEGTHNFIANGICTHNCIYTWRNATIENLLSFEREFPNTKVVLLEQNYRSTRTILTVANAVIAKNVNRVPKNLFTENETGEPIGLFAGENEVDEAFFIAHTAARAIARPVRGRASNGAGGVRADDIAVLYRNNFQSRALEEAFLTLNIPYRVLGTRFFERKEVKDLLSYVRAALNPKSRNDIARIISVPSRGIGKTTLEKMLSGQPFGGAAREKANTFWQVLARIRKACETVCSSEALEYATEASGLLHMYKTMRQVGGSAGEEAEERLANIRELVNLAARYDSMAPPEGIERLLEEAALASEQDELKEDVDAVSLMTVHAAKGLEFGVVFVTGLEQGLFPHIGRGDDNRDAEEERRLFYVALTRAKRKIFLSYAQSRSKWGTREPTMPSEFLLDIDERLVEHAEYGDEEEKIIT